ncbi:pyridoxal-phosphate-dependent aminotransferase family protein [Haloglomus salinum]|uniref:pyridoxal-phosphate-dependent aminotransferase family protein n=1 Tax=Haloglomus salinum TaxID=2962673 RepID=UPI0020C9F18D|nr:alanine--glyoxylate aminotransferase family protein [Haloglomus salinum]
MQRPQVGELSPPDRLLMGPGPSEVHPRTLRAMAAPPVGHLDPAFLDVMDETQELLRYVLQTDNKWTIPVSGTGSAAMEAAIGNLTRPGDTVLVPSNGYFGGRMAAMVRRAGGDPVRVDAPWGEPLDPDDVQAAFAEHDPDLFGFVHAETSTGVRQPDVPALTDIAHDNDALVVADVVTSLGGVEFRMDDWGVDAAYSAGQKCLSCPPGASPLSLNHAAMERVQSREERPRSWYLDLTLLDDYWGEERAYHHTAPVSNVYALRESLRLVAEEGLEDRWARHERVAGALREGLAAMGLAPVAEPDWWLPSLNTARLPEAAHVEPGDVIDRMLEEHGIEIAGGLGDLAGEVLRVGCMGHGATPDNVTALVAALGDSLLALGVDVDADAGLATVRESLRSN